MYVCMYENLLKCRNYVIMCEYDKDVSMYVRTMYVCRYVSTYVCMYVCTSTFCVVLRSRSYGHPCHPKRHLSESAIRG